MTESDQIENMCTWCARKCSRLISTVRPETGACPKRPKSDGIDKPHVCVVNGKR